MYIRSIVFLLLLIGLVYSGDNLRSQQLSINESQSTNTPKNSNSAQISNSFKTILWVCVGFGISFVIFGIFIFWIAKKYQAKYAEEEFFEDEKAKRNNVNSVLMSEQVFESNRKKFMQSIWNFRFMRGNKAYVVSNYCVKMTKISKFCYQIKMEGQDILGTWNGTGYYLHKQKGIEIWIKKNYVQKINKAKTKYWKRLFFEGSLSSDGNYSGKWYIMGLQQNPAHSGLWMMKHTKVQQITATTTNIIAV